MVAAIRALSVNVCFDTVRLLVPDSTKAPESPQALTAAHGAFMSEILDCDPARGFVAFPVAVFDLDLTPGAFRTLAELCRMANTDGQCWPSLAQLGRRLGRSRAAVSGYIAELRAADVLRTEEQKMANGYNYRLRYTVTFWKAWRAGLTQKPERKPERSVRSAERPLETQNHIHKNHCAESIMSGLVSDWKRAVGKTPYPGFTQWPSENLLAATDAAVLNAASSAAPISADIADSLRVFLTSRGIDPSVAPDLAREISPQLGSKAHLTALIGALEDGWQPHWRNPPNGHQLKRLLGSMPPVSDPATEQKLLKSYLRRWKLYQRSLPSAAIRSKVAA